MVVLKSEMMNQITSIFSLSFGLIVCLLIYFLNQDRRGRKERRKGNTTFYQPRSGVNSKEQRCCCCGFSEEMALNISKEALKKSEPLHRHAFQQWIGSAPDVTKYFFNLLAWINWKITFNSGLHIFSHWTVFLLDK